MKLETKELSPKLLSDVEKLFGKNGACGGCWCMFWRIQKGENWAKLKGEANKRAFRKLISEDKAHGIIAYADGEPVGWASFDPRSEFHRLNRARTLKCDDVEKVWSIPCFFVHKDYRGKGIGGKLLAAALKAMKKQGAKIAEGYPIKLYAEKIPAAFAYTGTPSLFKKAGFKPVGIPDASRLRVRASL